MPTVEEQVAAHLRDSAHLEMYERLKQDSPFVAAAYQEKHGSAIWRAAQLRNDHGESLLPARAIEPRHVARRI